MNDLAKTLAVIVVVSLLVCLFSGCTNQRTLTAAEKFKIQSCVQVYCDKSEDLLTKKLALKIIEGAAGSQGISLDLKRGACETRYAKRELNSGYLYATRTPLEYCQDDLDPDPVDASDFEAMYIKALKVYCSDTATLAERGEAYDILEDIVAEDGLIVPPEKEICVGLRGHL